MAKILILDKKQYLSGLIPLRRGDKWILDARVVDRIGNVDTVVDLSGAAVTGFFDADDAADSDGVIAVAGTLQVAADGVLRFTMAAASTPLVAEASEGTSLYATVLDASGALYTVETVDSPLEIKDRGFNQF